MLRLLTLGSVTLECSGRTGSSDVELQPKRLALLVYLAAARPREPHRRDTLLALFWPELDQDRARKALRNALYYLREELGREVIRTRGEGVAVDTDHLWCDAAAFGSALKSGDRAAALELYRGDFLEGFHVSEAPDFDRWLVDERARLQRRAKDAARKLSEEAEEAGNLVGAVSWARRAVGLDPTDERALRHMLRLLATAGDRSAAVRAYQNFRARLEAEWDLEPAPATVALVEEIRALGDGRSAAESETEIGPSPDETPDRDRGYRTGRSVEDATMTQPDSGSESGSAGPISGQDDADIRGSEPPGVHSSVWRKKIGIGLVGTLLLFLAGAWIASRPSSRSGPPAEGAPLPALEESSRTIAVLPLEPLGVAPDDETLASGIHSDLITALSKVGGIRVIQRASTLPYRPGERSLERIASELGADLIVEGDVRQLGRRVRVNVRLTEARTERVIWGDSMDRQLTVRDLFELQTDIVERIVGALERSLTPTERERIATPPTERLSALQFYHRQGEVFDGTRTGNVEQERLLRRALAIDPSFAQAWAVLGVTYAWRPLWTGFTTTAWDSAVAFAQRALDEDPENATAYAALSDVYGNQGFQERAIRTARKALKLDPNYSFAFHRLGRPLHESGEFVEGLRYLRAAVRLSPNEATFRAWVGHVYVDLGDYERARRWYEATLDLHPDSWQGLEGMAWMHLLQGRADSALMQADRIVTEHPGDPGPLAVAGMIALFGRDYDRAAQRLHRVLELAPDAPVHGRSTTLVRTMLGFLRLRTGDAAAADTLFDRSLDFVGGMIEKGAEAPRWAYEMGQIQSARGRTDEGMEWLERAYEDGFRWAWMLERNPLLDPIRDNPRFRGLVARIETDVEAMRRRAEALHRVDLEKSGERS